MAVAMTAVTMGEMMVGVATMAGAATMVEGMMIMLADPTATIVMVAAEQLR
jgi:hypothetical protein